MTRMWNRRVVAMLAALWLANPGAAAPAAAQTDARPRADARVWTEVFVQGRVDPGSSWRWTSEAFVRTRDGAGTLDFLGERVIVIRDVTPRSAAGVGYAYGSGFPNAGPVREHRIVQQYVWSAGGHRRVALKSQLEERFIAGRGVPVVRARQQVRVLWPLAAHGKVRGVFSEDVFLQVNSTSRAARGFDGNLIFLGLNRRVTPRSAFEIGYLNIAWRPGSSPSRSHVLAAALMVSM
jgi:hypothetical protein